MVIWRIAMGMENIYLCSFKLWYMENWCLIEKLDIKFFKSYNIEMCIVPISLL
jgi:hypothetical protein